MSDNTGVNAVGIGLGPTLTNIGEWPQNYSTDSYTLTIQVKGLTLQEVLLPLGFTSRAGVSWLGQQTFSKQVSSLAVGKEQIATLMPPIAEFFEDVQEQMVYEKEKSRNDSMQEQRDKAFRDAEYRTQVVKNWEDRRKQYIENHPMAESALTFGELNKVSTWKS